ncbi:hypothetical protein GE061_015828 [Apolygus lucorum]|uniref:Uncharacterized protein n=1 Tax=Apolygus lucorum TaxID=248454 RepID=A0A8S9XLZ8_APOLU|nr:hypothetical protein GE061_015828 [Apolygus lucorum]
MGARFHYGVYDTFASRRSAFPTNVMGSELCLRFADLRAFEDHPSLKLKMAYLMAIGACAVDHRTIRDAGLNIAILETIAPELPREMFLEKAAARRRFVRCVIGLLVSEGIECQWYDSLPPYSFVEENRRDRLPGNQPATPLDCLKTLTARPTIESLQDLTNAEINPIAELLAELLAFIAEFRSTDRLKIIPTSLYVLMYVSLSKRGTITDNKLTAIRDEVYEANGRRINISPDDVRKCFAVLHRFIDQDNAEAVFGRLALGIEGISLRMHITLTQAAGGGLTAYHTIRSALKIHPLFPWSRVRGYIPNDFTNFRIAFDTVGNNQYYGFKHDLGCARSTKFPSLTYVAKEILLRWNAADFRGLRGYQGFKDPNRKNSIGCYYSCLQPNC